MLIAFALALATTLGPGLAAPGAAGWEARGGPGEGPGPGKGGPGAVAPGVVQGQVRSESSGAPLALAMVEVLQVPYPIRAITDSTGAYVLRHVPAGRHIVRASHLDHAPFEIEVLVPPGGEMTVDLSLALRPVSLPAVTARVRVRDGVDTAAAGAPELSAASMRLLQSSPGVAELGLAQAARGSQGGNSAGDPSEVLYVRGGAADLKLVLLDGAPVYAPFHVGGLLAPLDADVLRSATLYVGGAPARYDGGLSYVLDMQTRAPRRDQTHAAGSVDLLSARALADGPITSHAGYMISARGVHGLAAQHLVDGTFPYTYADGLARLDTDLGGGRSLRATGFWNREAVRLDAGGPDDDRSAHWGNSAAAVHYHGQIAGADGELSAATGEYDAVLPIGGQRPMLADGTSRRMRLAADFSESAGSLQLYWGASYDRLTIQYLGWSLAQPDSLVMNAEAGGNAAGAYVDAAAQPASRLRLRGGLRVDFFAGETRPRTGPRMSATWAAGPHTMVTLAAGRYHQYLRATEAAVVSAGAAPESHRLRPLSVAEASHVVLSLDQELVRGTRLGVETYLKRFQGIPVQDSASAGPARSSGVDLWVRRTGSGVTGWVGYSLSWIWSAGDAAEAADLFAGRQLLSAGVGAQVIGRAHLDLRLSYGSGMPFTAVPQPDRPPAAVTGGTDARGDMANVVPLPAESGPPTVDPSVDDPYLRVDAQLARSFEGQLHGMAFEVTPYLRVLNALDRRDALFYQFDRSRDRRPQAVAALPILPIVGFSWRF